MTIDNLVSADVVGADGILRVASSTTEPDLFWAIRGGGGNFGVVTSFELQLHPVGPLVHAGLIVYPAAQARDVLRRWRDFTDSAPEQLSSWLVLRRAPPLPFLPPEVHGTDVVVVPVLYAGPADAGPRATAPLATLGKPIAEVLGAQPYEQFQQAFDPLLAFGARNYWKSSDFEELSDDALDAFVDAARAVPGSECEVFVAHLGGAMGRVPADATAYVGRNAHYVMNVHGRWRSPTDDELVRSWARGVFDSVSRFATGGGYVNFFTADEGARVESAYGANYERLAALKERFDPENLFRMNHNIAPLRGAGRPRRRPGAPRGASSGR
jgi:FAD/FMN-containing dehydrogenase